MKATIWMLRGVGLFTIAAIDPILCFGVALVVIASDLEAGK